MATQSVASEAVVTIPWEVLRALLRSVGRQIDPATAEVMWEISG